MRPLRIIITSLALILSSTFEVQADIDPTKGQQLQTVLDELTSSGIPGVSLAIFTHDGWWYGSSGFAHIESQEAMGMHHLHFLQSIAKTYMAVAIMQLYEQGKIDLEAPITKYLPIRFSGFIKDAGSITVKMLLNHTSGIPEYNSAPGYVTKLLQQPGFDFQPVDYLKFIKGKDLDFSPGSKYSYRNTNYLLLALIADEITGDHASFIVNNVFAPLGLESTYYRGQKGYLTHQNMVSSYWDRNSNAILENVNVLQTNNVKNMIGDDGIVATPQDAVIFLKALFEGKLVSNNSLEMMKTWVKTSKGVDEYGLGLDLARFNGIEAVGHSGGGIGAGCQLYYFPSKEIYVFIGINLGTVTHSPIHETAEPLVNKLYEVLLK